MDKPEIILAGRRVFLVEDEALVAMMFEDYLLELGCEIAGTASRFQNAMEKAQSLSFDVAVLDVNLAGEQTFPIAELLASRHIPFMFATGYGASGVPTHLRDAPVVQKPFRLRDLESALHAALRKQP
jgi:DNA-binding response OmpR family regulator